VQQARENWNPSLADVMRIWKKSPTRIYLETTAFSIEGAVVGCQRQLNKIHPRGCCIPENTVFIFGNRLTSRKVTNVQKSVAGERLKKNQQQWIR
jgi:hypothetical protein